MKVRLSKLFLVIFTMCIFSCVTVFGATVGNQLLEPEKGWQRIDDTNESIIYVGDWETVKDHKSFYNETEHFVDASNIELIKFKFYGSKIRYISNTNNTGTSNARIKIDGVEDKFKIYSDVNSNSYIKDESKYCKLLLYENQNLSLGWHEVEVYTDTSLTTEGVNNNLSIDAIDIDENGYIIPYDMFIPTLNIKSQQNKVNLKDEVVVDVVMENAKNIAAEDIYVKYDSEKLKYIGCKEVDGIRLVYNDEQNGTLRFILASKGESNIINTKKALLNLNFKAIAPGEALVDITKGRITDGIEMEKDVEEALCGQATIVIGDSKKKDVNNSGEFTLLDLGIDARHFGKNPKAEDLTKYNTDIAINEAIDEDDLLEIGKLMIANDNYAFNK